MGANFQKIIDKISEAFSFFDFSFLISGAASFGICCYGLNRIGMRIESNSMALNVIVAIFAIYISGLISFAIGRRLRKKTVDHKGEKFKELIIKYTLYASGQQENSKKRVEELEMMYTQMWTCLRDNPAAKDSLAFLNRMWVMQAVFEGLLVSSLLAILWGTAILCICKDYEGTLYDAWCMIVTGVISAIACHIEGTRYAEYQIKDVTATYYKLKKNSHGKQQA